MERGVRNGYPVVDLRVTLTDGKAHSVDSSDMAFQMAGALALREAAGGHDGDHARAATTRSTVVVPDDHVGSDHERPVRRAAARLLGTDKVGDDRTVIKAEVPQTELVRYAVDLRSSTHGAGTFTRSFAHYEPMPEDVARSIAPRER